ncbi:MAG: YkgJ family cysteine cluster protein [Myxococcales bacterium]|nr:MAG: YkgJ family cysteine cluster protein [Myxococcales bacterium]
MPTNENPVTQIAQMSQAILESGQKLTLNDTMTFSCHPGVPCFGNCCADVNILLTPYCVLRLKRGLKISSEEFVSKYAMSPPISEQNRIPLVFLRMSDNEKKTCPFLTEKGCGVYEDRPWACRMYPLGVASQKTATNPYGEQFYYLIHEPQRCKGHGIGEAKTLAEYVVEQGVPDYDRMNDLFRELTLHPFFRTEGQMLPPQQVQMFYMACYNLDLFKRFLFNSRFFEMMEIPADMPARLREEEEELLTFAFQWLRFSLFGEGPIKVKPAVMEAKREELARKHAEQEK